MLVQDLQGKDINNKIKYVLPPFFSQLFVLINYIGKSLTAEAKVAHLLVEQPNNQVLQRYADFVVLANISQGWGLFGGGRQ